MMLAFYSPSMCLTIYKDQFTLIKRFSIAKNCMNLKDIFCIGCKMGAATFYICIMMFKSTCSEINSIIGILN